MANITIQIPDAAIQRVTDAFVIRYGYQDTVPDPNNPDSTIPNPETKPQFVQRMIRNFVKDTTASHEGLKAQGTADQQVRDALG